MKKLLCYILFIPVYVFGQEQPLYNHFYINPYVYNPAYAGSHGYSVGFVNYRNQWADIEGAPSTYTFTFDVPFENGVAFGANVFSDERGFVTTNSGQLTFGYRVPFSEDTGLNFGLSGGAGTNNVDFSQLPDDAFEDPAIQSILENNFFVSARFGLNFDFRNVHLGLVLPNLIKSDIFSTESFSEFKFDAVSQYMLMGKVKLEFSPELYVQPFVIYKQLIDGKPQIEGIMTVHFKNAFWIGGGYRQDYGPHGIVGLQLKDVFTMGYSYELAEKQTGVIGGGTHEFQISLRLGKNKKKQAEEKQTAPNIVVYTPPAEPKEQETIVDEPEEHAVETETVTPPTQTSPKKETVTAAPIIIPSHRQEPEKKETPPVVQTPAKKEPTKKGDSPVIIQKGSHADELHQGHYVIVGAFGQKANASRAASDLNKKGKNAAIGYVSERERYYVYISKSDSPEEARRVRDKVRNNGEFPSAWYLLMQDEKIKDMAPVTTKRENAPQKTVEQPTTTIPTKENKTSPVIIIPASGSKKETTKKETPKTKPTEEAPVVKKVEEIEPSPAPKEQQKEKDAPIIVKKGKHPLELSEGHYVIVGAFGSLKNAENLSDKLFDEGFHASFGFVSEKNLFYVYLIKTTSASTARKERDRLRQYPEFNKAWYLLVQE